MQAVAVLTGIMTCLFVASCARKSQLPSLKSSVHIPRIKLVAHCRQLSRSSRPVVAVTNDFLKIHCFFLQYSGVGLPCAMAGVQHAGDGCA